MPITEYGYSLVTWKDGPEATENAHYILEERREYQSTNHVMGNPDVFFSNLFRGCAMLVYLVLFGTSKNVLLSCKNPYIIKSHFIDPIARCSI
jgi:hypothetical protein